MLEENLIINEPGLNVLPPGVERYVIHGTLQIFLLELMKKKENLQNLLHLE
ncbi:hypothetical protein OAY27_03180 [Candidatus Pelagibacter sp.]|nr:hypothetical protein [Candidatus Pelagibacter sp.]